MDKLKKSEYKVYGAIAGFLLIVSVGFIFALFPIIRGIVHNSDEIQKKKIDNEINQQGISKIPEMEALHSVVKEKEQSLRVIIEDGGEVEFFKKVESLAVETGNRIEFKIEEGEAPKKKTKSKEVGILESLPYKNYILMEITLLGNYENLIKFLNKLEKNEKYVNVASLNVSKVEVIEKSVDVFNSNGRTNSNSDADIKEILQSTIDLVIYIRE